MSLELPWLAEPWEKAARALASGRLPAGLLILGAAGLGREKLARAIAAAGLCLEPRADLEACGACASCRELRAGTHPDFFTLCPPEDKTSIGIDQIRELASALALTAGRKASRVAIIRPADRMTEAAINALLKTLEEPAPGVTLILIATLANSFPPTLPSRCLKLAVPVPGREAALSWLAQRSPRADWSLLLALAAGAPLLAQTLAEGGADGSIRLTEELISAAAGRADPLAVAARFGDWPLTRLAVLIAWVLEELLRLVLIGEAPAGVSLRGFAAIAARANLPELSRLWHEAITLGVQDSALNAALARERLVLLFVDAFRRSGVAAFPAPAPRHLAATARR